MNRQRKFIEKILQKVERINDGIFIPQEIELQIENIDDFDITTATELSKINETIFTEESGRNNDVFIKNTFSTSLINIDNELRSIKFYPAALKIYLSKIK